MARKAARAALAVAVLSLSTMTASAQDDGSGSSFNVYLGLERFEWKEFDTNDNQVLEEDGPRFSLGFAVDNYMRRGPGMIYGLDARGYWGEVDYDGQTLGGTPVQTETEYAGWRVEGIIGARTDGLWQSYDLDYFGGIGADVFDRDIQDTATVNGYEEEWTVYYGKLGLGLVYTEYTDWFTRVQLGVKQIIDVEEDVPELNASGLSPGNDASLFARVDVRRAGPSGITASVYYDGSYFERSGSVNSNIGAVVQPESDQEVWGLELGYRF